jgi:hypothetical protein
MKLFFAAPDSGLPSALTALVAQLSAIHFFMKDVFAAPASAFPSLPTALLSQVSCAKAAPPANVAINAASNMLLIILVLPSIIAAFEFDRKNAARSSVVPGFQRKLDAGRGPFSPQAGRELIAVACVKA